MANELAFSVELAKYSGVGFANLDLSVATLAYNSMARAEEDSAFVMSARQAAVVRLRSSTALCANTCTSTPSAAV